MRDEKNEKNLCYPYRSYEKMDNWIKLHCSHPLKPEYTFFIFIIISIALFAFIFYTYISLLFGIDENSDFQSTYELVYSIAATAIITIIICNYSPPQKHFKPILPPDLYIMTAY